MSNATFFRDFRVGGGRRANIVRAVILLALAVCTLLAAVASMKVGTVETSLSGIADALFRYDQSREHIILRDVRLPRLLAGLLVGASLAMAGAVMQAVTGNPLASPGLLGINAGAAFAVVLAITLLGASSESVYVWCAFGGAACAAFMVYVVGSAGRREATPVRLALAGAVLSTFLAALTATVLIFDQATLDSVRLWSVGSLVGRQMSSVQTILPYTLIGIVGTLLLSREIMTLSLGRTIALSVGQNPAPWQIASALLVVLLAGSAVALAGPVGFVGLVVPHMARLVMGRDYRWILPFCLLGGACLVVTADGLLRAVLPVRDVPVGVTMALLGAPVFIYLVRGLARR